MNTLLFDIGATKTRFALAHHGRLGRVTTLPTPSRWRDVEPAYRRAMINVLAGRSVAAAVGGIPGTLNQKTGGVIRASNLRGWDQQPITAVLRRVFSVRRVRIENDANLAGLGEAVYGAGRGFRIVAYLGIGTGVGGTRIIDRHLDPAPTGFRPGHQVIDRSSHARCGCGQRGDLESLISGRGLARLYHRPAEELPRRVFISAARTLGIGLNNITVMWTPDVIVLGGSVMVKLWPHRPLIRDGLRYRTNPPEIIRSKLGDAAGLYGALALTTSADRKVAR